MPILLKWNLQYRLHQSSSQYFWDLWCAQAALCFLMKNEKIYFWLIKKLLFRNLICVVFFSLISLAEIFRDIVKRFQMNRLELEKLWVIEMLVLWPILEKKFSTEIVVPFLIINLIIGVNERPFIHSFVEKKMLL